MSICEEALTGEVFHFRFPSGRVLELSAVKTSPKPPGISEEDLAKAYDDPEWAAFENRCGKASD